MENKGSACSLLDDSMWPSRFSIHPPHVPHPPPHLGQQKAMETEVKLTGQDLPWLESKMKMKEKLFKASPTFLPREVPGSEEDRRGFESDLVIWGSRKAATSGEMSLLIFFNIKKKNASLSFFFFFGPAACGILVPDQGSKFSPLQWELGILTTGPPGKSWNVHFSRNTFHWVLHPTEPVAPLV